MDESAKSIALNRWKEQLADIESKEQSNHDMFAASRLRRDIKRLEGIDKEYTEELTDLMQENIVKG